MSPCPVQAGIFGWSDLMQILCMQSQPRWFHACSGPVEDSPFLRGLLAFYWESSFTMAVLFKFSEPQEPGLEHFCCCWLALLGRAHGLLSLIACPLLLLTCWPPALLICKYVDWSGLFGSLVPLIFLWLDWWEDFYSVMSWGACLAMPW